ncbi:MAG: hypothetical protein KKG09_06000 [Verrucomicrobia bacterium]|nr:hypothetical protein [Verrucomicrobiota bacterium]MBU4248171.1 hypothetical protein [Verrucomicrobiota bacterium]MBU4289680.1 hypothetical protein [Verrucomicrobiota bacterium]MBU4497537.1 hypothetical protein [Verrucomicrobiota bacterium]MCG2679621.1 hypothetical protein [Kiritimatiellia bacterium]
MNFDEFIHPPLTLRPALFWAINDRLSNKKKAARQFRDMLKAGFSGAFFHSRPGLISEYLGKEWFDAIEATLDAAREADGCLWLYDEDQWPSGNAGGLVAAQGEAFRMTWLQPHIIPKGTRPTPPSAGSDKPKLTAVYHIIRRAGTLLKTIQRAELADADDPAHERLVFFRHVAGPTARWSGESYANLLNPDVTRAFISLTHEKYRQHFAAEFGKHIPGIFTDEPYLVSQLSAVPWWEGLPDAYRTWMARDFWQDLPYLFFDGPESRRIRLLIHRTLHRQFVEAYSKPLFEWCTRHKLELTGHYNVEDTLSGQIANNAGGVMGHYPFLHRPGVDALTQTVEDKLLTYAQVASAARQLARPAPLNEIFGVTRHSCPFEEFRWMADVSLAAGVSFLVPHLSWYSMKGKRKRDYPPNWNYQQTYWDELKPLNDYFARTAAALSAGERDCGILILHPIEAATAETQRAFSPAVPDIPHPQNRNVARLDQLLRICLLAVYEDGRDADLGDEGFLANLGSIRDSRIIVGAATYHTIIAPEARTWRPTTFALLKAFAEAGGRILFTGRLPEEADCLPEPGWRALINIPSVTIVPADPAAIRSALGSIPNLFRITGADGGPVPGLRAQHRVDGAQDIFFIVNTDRQAGREITLRIHRKDGQLVQLDAVEGTRGVLKSRRVGNPPGYLSCDLHLEPMGSLLLTVDPATDAKPHPRLPSPERARIHPLPGHWRFTRKQPNVLVLDHIAYSLDEGKTFLGPMPEYAARHAIADHFGAREALTWQPWAALKQKAYEQLGGTVTLRYAFHSTLTAPHQVAVVIENLMLGNLIVNGQTVRLEKAGWHWDTGFGKIDISGLVNPGDNIIDFALNYSILSEVESAYLIGDFGVRFKTPLTPELCEEPKSLTPGSWTRQGYPFYAGAIMYQTQFHLDSNPAARGTVALRLNRPAGVLFHVRLNGEPVGDLRWRPWQLDLSRQARGGINNLEIEVVASLQNSHGPLHLADGESLAWQGSNAFEDPALLMESYSLADTGLLEGAEILTWDRVRP